MTTKPTDDQWLDEMFIKLKAKINKRLQDKEAEAIKVLAKAQLKMRPLIALEDGNGQPNGQWYVMHWDDAEQVWNRARYADIVSEVEKSFEAKINKLVIEGKQQAVANFVVQYKQERTNHVLSVKADEWKKEFEHLDEFTVTFQANLKAQLQPKEDQDND